MRFVPGPDFPTGGLIVGTEGIEKAYHTGRGRVIMRARIGKETRRGGREQLVVTEIPYATNKTRIIEQIVDLNKKGKVSDLSDLRDESDRDGIRIVIELKRGADANKVVKALLKWTSLQSTFGVIALALDNGVPREFSLKEMLERFRDHRIEVIVRRSQLGAREGAGGGAHPGGAADRPQEHRRGGEDHPLLPHAGERRRASFGRSSSSPSARPRRSS